MRHANDPETVKLLLQSFREYALQHDMISVFLRLHPLLMVKSPQAVSFTLENGIAQNHLAATNNEYLRFGPSKLMMYSQVRWLKYAGGTVFHLGGGVSSRPDSLFHFKAGFSGLRASFCTCSVIIDEDRYMQLVKASGAGIREDEDFFPAFRRPLALRTAS